MAPASMFTGSTIEGIDHLRFSDSRIHWIVYFRKFLVYVEYVEYREDKPKNTASTIDKKYSSYPKNEKNKIYFFWTNGTIGEATQVHKHLVSKLGEEQVILLEKTDLGIEMEDIVNSRLSRALSELGYDEDSIGHMKSKRKLWPELFGQNVKMIEKHSYSCKNKEFSSETHKQDILKKIDNLKKELEDYQKNTSKEYAQQANAKCFIMKFKRQGKESGACSKEEDKVLKEKHLQYHGFVAIANKKG